MISKSEKKQLKSIIGSHYSEAVVSILNSKGIVNRNKRPHNEIYVRMVFIGDRNNADVEAAIWELASIKQEETKADEKAKQKILEKK